MKVTSTSGKFEVLSESPEETAALGRRLGERLFPGACVALYGELGSGKTVFARGVIHGAGVEDSVSVTSPSFVIVSEYKGRLAIHHIDAYRLAGAKDIIDLGSTELLFGEAVSIVEWADRVASELPDERIDVTLEVAGESERRIEMRATGKAYEEATRGLDRALTAQG